MTGVSRRELIGKTFSGAALIAAATVSSSAAVAATSPTQSLESAFRKLETALRTGDLEGFWGTIDKDAVIIDEDLPFIMTKADFRDHIDFHTGGVWSSFTWLPRAPQFTVMGDSGVVAGYATFRGKPKDAGFRQVHMTFTQSWHWSNNQWRLVNWHQSPLKGHILEGSPS